MKQIILVFLIGIGSALQFGVLAQGCSDAGICTLPGFRPVVSSDRSMKRHHIMAGISAGAADQAISVLGASVGYAYRMHDKWGFDTRVTFQSMSGNGVAVSGPGDVFLNLTYHLSPQISLTGGSKIPLMRADREYMGHPLPMDYQPGLGTLDLVLGVSYKSDRWYWVAGYQQPLSDNENRYTPDNFGPGSKLSLFQNTNAFQRKSDLLLRASYLARLNDRMTMMPGLLPIYHLGEDAYTDADGADQFIEGSSGLTLNATVVFEMQIRESSSLRVSLGFPLIVREARPDGLTRGFVMGLEYGLKL